MTLYPGIARSLLRSRSSGIAQFVQQGGTKAQRSCVEEIYRAMCRLRQPGRGG